MQSQPHRSLARALTWLLMPVLVFLLAGCSSRSERLLHRAEKAEKAAHAAQARGDVEAANRAAADAKDAVSQLEKLVAEDKSGGAELRQLLVKAQAAAHSAAEFAALAGEERELREKLKSLKVRAYTKARSAILTTVLPPMALVAQKAGEIGTNTLSVIEQPVADEAWRVVALVSGRAALPDGRADWPGVASDLRRWSTNPPVEFRAFLGLAFVLADSSDFALAEFESVNAAGLRSTNSLRLYHASRALLYAIHGWNRLATREVAAFSQYADASGEPLNGKQILALLHGLLGYSALVKGEFEKMDAEISRSLQAWPDNPLVVYLTGERMAANGEWAKAASSLEAQAAGTEDEWIARRLSQRARDLRDGKGSAKALATDGQFFAELAAHFTIRAAKNTDAAKKLREAMDEAKAFGRELWQKVPLLGTPAGEKASESK